MKIIHLTIFIFFLGNFHLNVFAMNCLRTDNNQIIDHPGPFQGINESLEVIYHPTMHHIVINKDRETVVLECTNDSQFINQISSITLNKVNARKVTQMECHPKWDSRQSDYPDALRELRNKRIVLSAFGDKTFKKLLPLIELQKIDYYSREVIGVKYFLCQPEPFVIR